MTVIQVTPIQLRLFVDTLGGITIITTIFDDVIHAQHTVSLQGHLLKWKLKWQTTLQCEI